MSAVITAPDLTLRDKLHAHLLSHMDADYAAFILSEIDKFCCDNKPRKRGEPIPTMWDHEIARTQAKIEDQHTGGERLKNYKGVSETLRTLEIVRDRSRQSGAPVNECRTLLIQLLDDLYPLNIRRKSLGKKFEHTVALTFLLAGLRPLRGELFSTNSVHSAVINSLDCDDDGSLTMGQIAAEIAFREKITFDEAWMEYQIRLNIA